MKSAHFELGTDSRFYSQLKVVPEKSDTHSISIEKDRLSKTNWVHGQVPVKYQSIQQSSFGSLDLSPEQYKE